jgi:LPS sulfotransferase NodH
MSQSADKRSLRKSLRTDFSPGLKTRAKRAIFRLRQTSHLPAMWRGGDLDRPIFIIGAPRSGTSVLYSVIRASERLAHWPGEAHEIWEADLHPALQGWGSNVVDPAAVEPKVAQRIRRAFFLAAGPHRRLVDKTPRNTLRVRFVNALFPDANFVFLHRDGRDNVNSLINAWRTPRYRTYRLSQPHSIPGVDPEWWKFLLYPGWDADVNGPLEIVCAKQWIAANRYALEDLERLDPQRWTRLRYEELIDDPLGATARVMNFIDVPVDERVRAKTAAVTTTPINTVTPPEPGKWRRENPHEIGAILPLIRPMMETLGYGIGEN